MVRSPPQWPTFSARSHPGCYREAVGLFEILLLIVILLLVFGAGKLPAIGDALGRTVKSFRRASRGASDSEIEVTKKTDRRLPPAVPPEDGADD